MVQTKSGAARNPWLVAQRLCADAYTDGTPIKAATKECRCEKTPAAKTKEVNKAVAKEKVATHAKAKQAARTLKVDAEKISQANDAAQKPARKANREKLVKHARESRQDMDNHATTTALAKVKAARARDGK